MDASPDVSVVIVSYNSRRTLAACLGALAETGRRTRVEIVMADNASSDGSADLVAREWPAVRVMPMGANLGFAKANNAGLSATTGRAILLLNPDTVVLPGAIDALADFLDAEPRAGVVAPKLLGADRSDQGTARSFPTPAAAIFGRRSLLTRLFPGNPWSQRYLVGRARTGEEPFEVDWVSGACLMIRRETLVRSGGLDERFFMYWEDADLCRRVKETGDRVYCVPAARVVHCEGSSESSTAPRLVWTFHRSAYRYFAKHHAVGAWSLLRPLAWLALMARAALLIALYEPSRRRSEQAPRIAGQESR